jgi:hypothetical protein
MRRISPICVCLGPFLLAQTAAEQRKVPIVFPGYQEFRVQWPPEAGTQKVGGVVMTATAASTKWITVQFRTVAEPPLPAPGAFTGKVTRVGNTLHRLLVDRNGQSYIGYDLVVSGDAANGFQAAFEPLSNAPEMLRTFFAALDLKPVPQPKYPAPQKVKQGEAIALDVMVSSDGRGKIVDYIQFSPPQPPDLPPATGTAPARDMTVDDEPLNLTVESLERCTVLIGGQKFGGKVGFVDGNGSTLWVALPGHGRYILSLAPHPGFVPAGTIREHVIAFRDGDRQFEVRLANPIAPAGNAWNLYVWHDAAFVPVAPAAVDAVIVGKGRLERLVNAGK